MPNALTQEEFILRAIARNGATCDYSQATYTHSESPVTIICKKHGAFQQKAGAHLRGSANGCHKCKGENNASSRRKDWGDFVAEAHKIHNNKYDYSKAKYLDNNTDICIVCPEHGEFWQKPRGHLYSNGGNGCPLCGRKTRGGWDKASWAASQKGREAQLYIIRCWSSEEFFFKVGITFDLKTRYTGAKIPYSWEAVMLCSSLNAGAIFDLEKALKKSLKKFAYQPTLSFGGQFECVGIEAPVYAELVKASEHLGLTPKML